MQKYFILLGLIFIISCITSNNEKQTAEDFPNEFPLSVGNKWIYKNVMLDNGDTTGVYYDTLKIMDQYSDDLFIYKWDKVSSSNIVKNEDKKLLQYGSINSNDTTIKELPRIWMFFENLGPIDKSEYSSTYEFHQDSIEVIASRNVEFQEKLYNCYSRITLDDNLKKTVQITASIGHLYWVHTNISTGDTTRFVELIDYVIY